MNCDYRGAIKVEYNFMLVFICIHVVAFYNEISPFRMVTALPPSSTLSL